MGDNDASGLVSCTLIQYAVDSITGAHQIRICTEREDGQNIGHQHAAVGPVVCRRSYRMNGGMFAVGT
jgi:hypothetical protein